MSRPHRESRELWKWMFCYSYFLGVDLEGRIMGYPYALSNMSQLGEFGGNCPMILQAEGEGDAQVCGEIQGRRA
jgi:hypothetical protein